MDNEQILINYTKSETSYLLAIRGDVDKVVSQEDEKSTKFVEELKKLISKYYGE